MTSDTVAGESPKCPAKCFKLTAGAEAFPRGREDVTVFDRAMGCIVRVVWHKREARASAKMKISASFEGQPAESQGRGSKENGFIIGQF